MRLKKLVLPSIFDTSLSSSMMWNLQGYGNFIHRKQTIEHSTNQIKLNTNSKEEKMIK